MSSDELLFSSRDSFSAQESQRQGLRSEVAAIDSNRFLNTNVDDLVGYLLDKFTIHVPQLQEDHMRADQREAKRDVSGDASRLAYHIGLQSVVIGTESPLRFRSQGTLTCSKFAQAPSIRTLRVVYYEAIPLRSATGRTTHQPSACDPCSTSGS